VKKNIKTDPVDAEIPLLNFKKKKLRKVKYIKYVLKNAVALVYKYNVTV